MTKPSELQYYGLGIAATTGVVIDTIKKLDGHGHDPDWRHMIDQSMAAIGALLAFVAYAERRISDDEGLSNVTLEPTLFGDYLPGDVADGVQP